MSIENQNTEATTENVAQGAPETKSEHMIPSYRLKEESDKRRTAETKLADYEKKEKEANDKDLSFETKYTKLQSEFDSFKDQTAKTSLKNEFISELVELGFPNKIANLASSNDLTQDNMKDHIKSFAKEMSDYLPQKQADTPKNEFLQVQPQSVSSEPSQTGAISGKDVMKDLMKNK